MKPQTVSGTVGLTGEPFPSLHPSTNGSRLMFRALCAEPDRGAIYAPGRLARMAAKQLSRSLVLPR
jgi:hypothetical protein